MKLPENYQNWIEIAKECNQLLLKHPDAKTIKFDYHGVVSEEFNINAVKAKAFNEVMELALAAKKEVKSLQNSIGTDMAVTKIPYKISIVSTPIKKRTSPNFRMTVQQKEALKTMARERGEYIQDYMDLIFENLHKIDVILYKE